MKKPLVDLHTHLLPQTDDGTRSIKESLLCFEKASELGYQTIVLTPHYLPGVNKSYQANCEMFRILRKKMRKKNITMNLILANEVMLSDDVVHDLVNQAIVTINDSRYLLVELPMYSNGQDVKNLLYKLKEAQIVPVIAHPERSDYLQTDITRIDDLLKIGVVLQLNAASLFGFYGKQAKEIAQELLQQKKVHLIASDAHSPEVYAILEKCLNYITKKYGAKTCEMLFSTNPQAIIADKDVHRIK